MWFLYASLGESDNPVDPVFVVLLLQSNKKCPLFTLTTENVFPTLWNRHHLLKEVQVETLRLVEFDRGAVCAHVLSQ